ncbi:Cwf15/Cwc15 cell cycle control protein [Tilletiaria anomala UBC 951]|uniref:Cwf15/Cwc15 cell cycle control protein n=1 Tax=Tilletiaria anomala (strain ATCC 24038 / CBS 436.72 / UBC 951) TaxID=1037660 RepID=A0A066WGV1_TILAU|nr:Cwf15/Cwc15 cell cycle control protein [Tilletiaria anomala UBC 951]KDN49930.1 Cwf15/Cwc15 cell cycle control protein [Tilletiaria anomala UBC 951]
MSSAHRPTWDPARGQNNAAHLSRVAHASQLPAHTTLKVRQEAQGGIIDRNAATRARKDLKAELERAEWEARNQKRIAQGLPPEAEPRGDGTGMDADDEHASKRRKLIEEAIKLDADDDSEEDEVSEVNIGSRREVDKGKGKARDETNQAPASDARSKSDSNSDSDSDDDSDTDDEEDDTAALLRELEKIKRERAEEKERQEREAAALAQSEREDEIALGNPLLNLENTIKNQNAAAAAAGVTPSFGVKRRWDDDVIFKNQAAGVDKKDRSSFVNDMIRTEFHKKFLYRYLK